MLSIATVGACSERAVWIPPLDGGSMADQIFVPDMMLPDMMLPDMMLPDMPRADAVGPSAPCLDRSAQNPNGMPRVSVRRLQRGGLYLAADTMAYVAELRVDNVPNDGLAVIDRLAGGEVAGFVLTRRSSATSVKTMVDQTVKALGSALSSAGATVGVEVLGTLGPDHEQFPAMQQTVLAVEMKQNTTVSAIRDQVLTTLFGVTRAEVGNLPGAFGSLNTKFSLIFSTVRHYKPRLNASTGTPLLDGNGYALDSGDASRRRQVMVGAVVLQGQTGEARRFARDLGNGTAVAGRLSTLSAGCDPEVINRVPMADIIWVMDESSSMDDNRQDMVNHANALFARAKASGVDFRMGVTGVCEPEGAYKAAVGRFCSVASSDAGHLGGTDRFLLSSEQKAFSGCIKNPPGKVRGLEFGLVNAASAVQRHLPRASGKSNRIRSGAKLVLIVATDEIPVSLAPVMAAMDYTQCTLSKDRQAQVDAVAKPVLDYLTGKTAAKVQATVHAIAGVCGNRCTADVAHGYRELVAATGGQVGDVCQKSLANTLNRIMDHIAGSVSPVTLKKVPVSATLAVSLNGRSLPQSTTYGYQFNVATNTLVFHNIPYKKGTQVLVGYRYWR